MKNLEKYIVPVNIIVYGEDEHDAISYVDDAFAASSFISEDGIIGVQIIPEDVEPFDEEEFYEEHE